MLAEIFVLRLEAIARARQDLIPTSGRFVPFNPVRFLGFHNDPEQSPGVHLTSKPAK